KDVVLPEFNAKQIETFIQHWFNATKEIDDGRADQLWEILTQPSHQATFELASSPLLLTFICLVYSAHRKLPSDRNALYEGALNILLEKWAMERRVQREAISPNFTPKMETLLLQSIAGTGFAEDRWYFSSDDLASQIDQFIQKELNAPKYVEGNKILS